MVAFGRLIIRLKPHILLSSHGECVNTFHERASYSSKTAVDGLRDQAPVYFYRARTICRGDTRASRDEGRLLPTR